MKNSTNEFYFTSPEYIRTREARSNFVAWFPHGTKEDYRKFLKAFNKFKIQNLTARSIEAGKIVFPDDPNPNGWKKYTRELTKDRLAYLDNLRFMKRREQILKGEYIPIHWREEQSDYEIANNIPVRKKSIGMKISNNEYLTLFANTSFEPAEEYKGSNKKMLYKCRVCDNNFSCLPSNIFYLKCPCPTCRKAAKQK
ncbi:hypothetical protein JXH92_003686 [Salmonella enterica subsp. enterica serovar 4,[5],12:b:-]|nr:hypothetical protein [Salmonella enterica subsp. enterica serovar 4,[5],12:b:-]